MQETPISLYLLACFPRVRPGIEDLQRSYTDIASDARRSLHKTRLGADRFILARSMLRGEL